MKSKTIERGPRGDQSALSMDELVLQDDICTRAVAWVNRYPVDSSMWEHAMQTLAYWNRVP